MIGTAVVEEILSTYAKHDWTLSRVLLSEPGLRSLGKAEASRLFGNCPVESADLDAIWFERPSKRGKLAIELRHLGHTPFALFEIVEADAGEEALAQKRREIERRMAAHASRKPSGPGH